MNQANGTVAMHAATPAVAAPFRALAFLRTPSAPEAPARLLVSRTVVHPFSRTTRLFGARALNNTATGNADAVTVSGLAGQPLCLHTADGDAAFTLPDVAGRPLWSRNAQGTVSTAAYEAANAGGRPLSLSETALGARAGRVREQYTYAPLAEAKWQARNLAGSQVELRNNAGISRPLSISLTGQSLAAEQRLLKVEIETPNWATTTEDDTEAPLSITGTHDATGAPLATTNAAGVTSLTDYAINGAVAQTRLVYMEQGSTKETVTLTAIQYRADGVVLSQTAGNGVIDRYEYDPKTQLLSRHLTERPEGHRKGPLVISDLHYRYDPVGNIISLEDQGADPTWHANQQATGLREYTYDTLYRLASATGRERTPVARYYGAEASSGSVWAPYSEHYTYDDGNNLTTIRHVSVAGNRTRELQVSEGSNRAMVKGHSLTPETGFLAGGLQKQLADGRALQWLADNQLGKVTPVSRVDGDDDSERYHYADGGTRTRKVHKAQVSAATQTTITTYAGGCEVRQRWLAGQDAPQKHIVISEGGDVRVVEDRLAGTVRLRYRFADHLGSVGGETDAQGLVLAREEYAPYGGTVGCDEAAEEASNLTQRTMRYSNKERDATGLYYYGWRYYQAELGRWLSADPGGLIDGINLYRFTRNNPIGVIDTDGRGCFPSRVAKAEGAQGTHDGAPHQRTVQRAPDIDVIIREVAVSYLEHFYADQGEDGGWEYYPAEDGYSYDKFESKWRSKLKAQGLVDEQVGQVFSQGLKRGERKAIREGETDRRNQVKAALEDKHRRKANFPRGIKLVYATNAGAKFINGHARFVSGKGKSPGAFNNDVANDVLGGLLVAQSEFTSLGLDKKVVEDTFEELRAMGDNSERIVKAFSDALNVPGAAYNGELYRGALMTPAEISEIESTSSYEADHFLSGDRRRAVAESFATPDKHDIEFAQGRTGVLFDLSGTGALKTLDYTEIEAIHLPGTRFKAVSSGMKNGLRCFRLTRWK